MEHLDGVVNRNQDTDRMSEDEVQFHYFKLHDYDNNNMLDGLELCAALTHYHAGESLNDITSSLKCFFIILGFVTYR
jgi:hypothetical protein